MVNVTLGQFFPGHSPLHRMDPRAKILLTVALIVAVFLASSLPACGQGGRTPEALGRCR